MKTSVAAILCLLVQGCARIGVAQEAPSPRLPFVRVHGESTVSAEPDQAQIDIGVVTQAAGSEAASDANARQANAVIDQLKAAAGGGASIKTVNFSVNPNYRYPKDGTPTISGYTANNTVRVELNDLKLLPRVIAVAAKSGANNINRLNYTLKDEQPFRGRALAEAAQQARAGAEALASAVHARLGRILQLEEGQPVVVSPIRPLAMAKAESVAEPPLSPGNIDVHASVDITFELLQ